MNKLVFVFITIILFIIIGFTIFESKENKNDNLNFKFEFEEIITTSNSIKIKIKNDNDLQLNYSLLKNDELIIDDKMENKYIEINDLEANTNYKIKINNDNNFIEKDIKTKKITTIRFGGDVMMTSFFADYINMYGVDYMWEDVSDLFNKADYSLVNLETSVSLRGKSNKPVGYGFRSHPDTLKGLVNAGIDFVTIANNHVFDYGEDAFYDTLKHLDEYKIAYTGAGRNINEAFKINYQDINDIKIAFLSATSNLGSSIWEADSNKVGLAALKPQHYERLKQQTNEAKANSDFVILNLHWGVEYENYPEQEQIDLAHSLIDSGADIIIGHHPHVLQGIEYYKKGIIFYSVGNFNFLISSNNTTQTAVFEINLDQGNIISSRMYPVKINSCKANLLSKNSDTYKEIINNINIRSNQFNTQISSDGFIKSQ